MKVKMEVNDLRSQIFLVVREDYQNSKLCKIKASFLSQILVPNADNFTLQKKVWKYDKDKEN